MIVLGSRYIAFPIAKFSIFIIFHIVIDGRISTIDHLICIGSSERKLILVTTDFFITFPKEVFKCCLPLIFENIFPQISHKDVETYLLKSRSDDNEKMSCYRQFIRGFNFYKENVTNPEKKCFKVNNFSL
jgi:hypothetical protein